MQTAIPRDRIRVRANPDRSSGAPVSLFCAAVLALAGCSGAPTDASGASSAAIVGGELDETHDSVFGIVIHFGQVGATCTATLIAPNVLLTARHCVAPSPSQEVVCGSAELGDPYDAENLYASNAVSMRQATRWFQGASVHVPSEGNDTCGYDVALVVLSDNVPAGIATPAVPRIDREVEAGETYVAVGYGVDEDGRAGERMVRGDLRVDCTPGSCGFGIRVSEFRGDAGICEGDSGGPAFDADGKVVGVVSRGAVECDSPVYGTVTAWKDLIMSVALQAAERGGYEPPFWATSGSSDVPVPEDEPGEIGDACAGSDDCGVGLACFQSADRETAACTARCEDDLDCSADLECRSVDGGAARLCLAPRSDGGGAAENTCAFTPASRGGSGAAGSLAALFALAGWGAGRRAARRRR